MVWARRINQINGQLAQHNVEAIMELTFEWHLHERQRHLGEPGRGTLPAGIGGWS